MTSLVDLENPLRTDYFGDATADTVEPSSSPSDDNNSPRYRALVDEPLQGSDQSSSPSPDRYRSEDNIDGDRSSRRHARFYMREGWESRKMSTLLLLTSERLEKEIQRANAAERKASDAMTLLRSTVEAKVLAQQEAARVSEELGLYKLQLENAQREIYKAQDLINQIEARRQEAEEAAARARSTARKLKEQNLVMLAREEGRQLGYREGLERGRRMGYEEGRGAVRFETSTQDDYVARSEDGSASDDQDYAPVDQATNDPLGPPFAAPTGKQEPLEPRAARPKSQDTVCRDTRLHAPTPSVPILTTPVVVSSPRRASLSPAPVPPTQNLMPSGGRKRGKSESQAFPIPVRSASPSPPPRPSTAIPPDNWIPIADKNNYIAMPPPHHMSPNPSPSYPSQQLPKSGPPTPEQDVIVMSATIGRSAGTSSIRVRDYAYDAVQDERLRPPAQPSSPLSQTSTRISDYGLLTSPPQDKISIRRRREGESSASGTENSGWKYDPRAWARRKPNTEESPRVSRGSRPRPESLTQPPLPILPPDMNRATGDRKPPGAKKSSTSSSSSSSSSSSATSTPDRTKHDPRKDAESTSRTPLSWLFKKRYKDRLSASGSSSSPAVGIAVISPSESSHAGSSQSIIVAEPQLLSPEYREAALPGTGSDTSRMKPRQEQGQKDQSSSLPPLAEFTNLILPGALRSTADLPMGFVPDPLQQPYKKRRGSTSSQSANHIAAELPPPLPPSRPESRNRKSSGVEQHESYETAPLTPGVSYPAPPLSPSLVKLVPGRSRSKSRSRNMSPS